MKNQNSSIQDYVEVNPKEEPLIVEISDGMFEVYQDIPIICIGNFMCIIVDFLKKYNPSSMETVKKIKPGDTLLLLVSKESKRRAKHVVWKKFMPKLEQQISFNVITTFYGRDKNYISQDQLKSLPPDVDKQYLEVIIAQGDY